MSLLNTIIILLFHLSFIVTPCHFFIESCPTGAWLTSDMLIILLFIRVRLVLLFHFAVLKKTWAVTAYAPWVAWWMSRVVSWPCYITANPLRPPALKTDVKSDKWHLWCHRPLFMQPQKGHLQKSRTRRRSEAHGERFDLRVLSYTTSSWFDVYWKGCLPDSQHRLVSQRLPTELFSSAPFLHACYFPCVLRERGDKASANLRLFS